MGDVTSTLFAAIVGGVLTAGGTIVVDWLKSRREQRQRERDHLRTNLYALQDAINEVFDAYQVAVESKNAHGAPWSQESNARLSRATRQLIMQMGRVGDSKIDDYLGNVIRSLQKTLHAAPEQAQHIFQDTAEMMMPPLGARIELLLHSDVKPDHRIDVLSSVAQRPNQAKEKVSSPAHQPY